MGESMAEGIIDFEERGGRIRTRTGLSGQKEKI